MLGETVWWRSFPGVQLGLGLAEAPLALCEVQGEGITGAITGRAIYEGTLDFAEAQSLADELAA